MTWIVFTILLTVLTVGAFWYARKCRDQQIAFQTSGDTGGARDMRTQKIAARAVAWSAIGGFALLTALSSVQIIPVGHVGVVTTFGSIDGQRNNGLTVIAPWSGVTVVSAQVQRKEFAHLAAFSKETQDVFVDATLNLSVSPAAIRHLYQQVGADWYNKLVPPRVLQTLKDETVKYTTVAVAPNRETIRKNVRERLQAQLSQYSINVEDFLLNNIDFRPEFKQAIENKQIATQNAQTAKNKVKQAEYEADQVAAAADGDARATLTKARAQATANHLLSKSVTPELIQFQAVQKLAPGVTTVILPSGSNFLLPSSVVGGK